VTRNPQPDAIFVEIPDAGRVGVMEQTEEVLTAINKFQDWNC
jgi:hypothetical protein